MRGFSLLELIVSLTVAALLLAIVLGAAWRLSDRMAVARAARETALFYHAARHRAMLVGGLVRVDFAADSLRAVLIGPPDSVIARRAGPGRHGATLTATQAAIVLDPTGFGFGAANTTLVLQRGSAVESLTTSRMGRLARR